MDEFDYESWLDSRRTLTKERNRAIGITRAADLHASAYAYCRLSNLHLAIVLFQGSQSLLLPGELYKTLALSGQNG